jgi:hypothetical protein
VELVMPQAACCVQLFLNVHQARPQSTQTSAVRQGFAILNGHLITARAFILNWLS